MVNYVMYPFLEQPEKKNYLGTIAGGKFEVFIVDITGECKMY